MTHPTPPNTELTDKQRAELEAAIKMANDMETIEGFIKHGRFVGDAVHVGIARLAEAIRLTRPTISGELDAVIIKAAETLEGYNLNGFHSKLIADLRNLITAKRTEGWQPIETCPSDGSPVWIYRPTMPDEQVAEAKADGEYWRGRIKYDYTKYPVTHWMPRNTPQPPQPTAEDRGV